MHLPENDPTIIRQILAVASSYYENREKLIYAYKGRTFLGGEPLYDHAYDGRGNIDCSTYAQLVMQGIDFAHSPYATGSTAIVPAEEYSWTQSCLYERLMTDCNLRRAHAIAKCYSDQGLCFADMSLARPGDLVFYRSPEEFVPFYREHGCFREICHVGIVAEDGASMYNSTGLPDKQEQEAQHLDAIQITPLVADRSPLLFARPDYGNK